MRKAAASLILALIAFALSSALVAQLASPRDREGLGYKLRYFEERKDSFDAVFFGSSMVMRGVMPRVFDAALRDRGHEIRSFNLGIPGMGDFEVDWILREVLSSGSERLSFVVLEPGLEVDAIGPEVDIALGREITP